jgi:paraquat-inducible protein A
MSALAAAADVRPVLLGCECCGLVSSAATPIAISAASPAAASSAEFDACPRCGYALHARKPLSLQRTWAYLIASALAYVPANLLPMMSTSSGFRTRTHTLLGGIIELWVSDAWGLAVIVFIASIAVPLLKIGALGLLAWSVRGAPRWRQLDRARLFRLIETVGHWSMLDVYVVVLLGAMVRFGSLASARPEPGLLAFAAVVVLTMLAAQSFDARLIWPDPEPPTQAP